MAIPIPLRTALRSPTLVDAATRTGDTLQMPDDGTVLEIAQVDAQHPVATIVQDLEVLDEVVLLQDAGDFRFSLETGMSTRLCRAPRRCGCG